MPSTLKQSLAEDGDRARKPVVPQVGSVVLAFAILRYLANPATSANTGVTAIARGVGASPSSCFNVLKTLVAERVASFDAKTKTYALGNELAELARSVLRRDDVGAIAKATMDSLARKYDATVGLWRVGESLMLVALSESGANMRIHMTIGHQQPLGSGAVGRSVVACRGLSRAEAVSLFAATRWQGSITATEYWRQIAAVRARGWALDENQLFRGITTIAAPIRDANDVRFCLALSSFSQRHSSPEIEAIGKAIKAAADDIARDAFGFRDQASA